MQPGCHTSFSTHRLKNLNIWMMCKLYFSKYSSHFNLFFFSFFWRHLKVENVKPECLFKIDEFEKFLDSFYQISTESFCKYYIKKKKTSKKYIYIYIYWFQSSVQNVEANSKRMRQQFSNDSDCINFGINL